MLRLILLRQATAFCNNCLRRRGGAYITRQGFLLRLCAAQRNEGSVGRSREPGLLEG